MSERGSSTVYILKAMQPRETSDRLVYPNLEREVETHRPLETGRIRDFWDSNTDSLDESGKAKRLAKYYLLATAQKLQTVANIEEQQKFSRRFTEASIELFGEPDATEAVNLSTAARGQARRWAEQLPGDELAKVLAERYSQLAGAIEPEAGSPNPEGSEISEVAAQLGDYLHQEFPAAFAVFEGEDRLIEASETAELFRKSLTMLKDRDPQWANWEVTEEANKETISVLPGSEQVSIGQSRSAEHLSILKGVFAHEVLGHALRCQGGYTLPDYANAEEGWGCFLEYAMTGIVPPKIVNRYVDIAYALGQLDGTPHSRQEVKELAVMRELVRSRIETGDYDEERVAASVSTHVNRIFRGTLGNEVIGVFTKDIAYYVGYRKIATFAAQSMRDGMSVEDLFSYMSQGKFDPTNQQHVEHITTVGRKNLPY